MTDGDTKLIIIITYYIRGKHHRVTAQRPATRQLQFTPSRSNIRYHSEADKKFHIPNPTYIAVVIRIALLSSLASHRIVIVTRIAS